MIQSETLAYEVNGQQFVGRFVWDDDVTGPRPGVLVAPAFFGLGQFDEDRARDLAGLGYAALALDYYGDGQYASSRDEASAWKDALEDDRAELLARMQGALAALIAREEVNADKVGAMGYCFGGKAVLDLARSGADVKAVAPIHGIFDRPDTPMVKMIASVLVLHGWADPLAKPEAVVALAEELDEVCEDWQIRGFGHVGHGFTNPTSTSYSSSADARSWRTLVGFFKEKLG